MPYSTPVFDMHMENCAGEVPTMTVVDPATRKLQIPSASVFPTQATARPSDRSPSLCMLFIQGRCRQGSHCHQVHADPDVVRRLREAAAARPTCCQRHGDDHTGASLSDAAPSVKSIAFDGVGTYPIESIATTQGAHKLLAELAEGATTLEVTKASVCRLQVLGRCRYAQDCNFVHVCRDVTEKEPAVWGADRQAGRGRNKRAVAHEQHAASRNVNASTSESRGAASKFGALPAELCLSAEALANGATSMYSTPPMQSPSMMSAHMSGVETPPMFALGCRASHLAPPQSPPLKHGRDGSWAYDPYSWPSTPTAGPAQPAMPVM